MLNTTLGRGLGALIPQSEPAKNLTAATSSLQATGGQSISRLPIDHISSNPWQPRTQFDDKALEELASSIKQYGIIQPLVVSSIGHDSYQLIAGERRLQAAKKAGLTEVPAIIRQAEEQQKLELALVENIQRQNLNPLDEALSYKRLLEEFNLTQEEVAARVGKSRSTVANFLRILNLPDEVLQAIRGERISFSHAKTIVGLPTAEAQIKMMKRIIDEGIPVSQLQRKEQTVSTHQRSIKDPVLKGVEERLAKHLGTRVSIHQKGASGTIEIFWQSEEDLKRLTDSLGN